MSNSATKETFSLMLRLCIICAVVAGLLALVNFITKPIIELNEQKVFEQSMAEVLQSNNGYEEIETEGEGKGVSLDSVYRCDNGFVITTVCNEGYGGDIKVMVGINNDLTVSRVNIMSMSETAGLGAKAADEKFWGQYSGLKNNIGVEKNNGGSAEDNTISAISGATVTSKAVTKAVNFALDIAGGVANE